MTILEILELFPRVVAWDEKDVNFDSLPNPSTDQEVVCQGEMTALQKSFWLLLQHFVEEATVACVSLNKQKEVSDEFFKLSSVRETAIKRVEIFRNLLFEDIREVFSREDAQQIKIVGWKVFYIKSKKTTQPVSSFVA